MRLIKIKAVMEMTGLCRSSVYQLITENEFPKQVMLGVRSVAWVEKEIEDWIISKVNDRNMGLDK